MRDNVRYSFLCPRCKKHTTFVVGADRDPPNELKCGDCLMNDAEIVDLIVVKAVRCTAKAS